MELRIYTSEQQDFNFYGYMGKHFANPEIIKELDNQIYKQKNSTWFVMFDGSWLIFENDNLM
ncbi:MAG: hypothetical protein PHW32_04740 [Bacilli bacterium]|nr:hypothetical protein [Bacilli bacterium]MDD4283076.1 hypothetical protein [Bacilli bacterium]MDD4718893.1 hypothetical protein [Bacilli bacterium]